MTQSRRTRPRGKTRKPKSRWSEVGKPVTLLVVVGVVFGLFFLFVYDPLQSGPIISATVERAYAPETRDATSVRVVVRFESGATAHVSATARVAFKAGQIVELEEQTSTVFRRKAYRFIRVVDSSTR